MTKEPPEAAERRAPELLYEWRLRAGLTQADAGNRVDVAQSTWSDWEAGRKSPGVAQAVALERLTEGHVPVATWPARPRRRSRRAGAAAKRGRDR
ncbi:helix-turn-helix transcriptional regulator [Sorangium sp. So ce131]|uniref:helix-turn-helix transcriptional regulator n=1 Tax=Sorangium sp. So ce131 TaxID=3133282 RepID=UPI003F5D6609